MTIVVVPCAACGRYLRTGVACGSALDVARLPSLDVLDGWGVGDDRCRQRQGKWCNEEEDAREKLHGDRQARGASECIECNEGSACLQLPLQCKVRTVFIYYGRYTCV